MVDINCVININAPTSPQNMYEVIIIGAGSAGLSAGIYAQRFGLKTLVIGKVVGGLLNDSHKVENYPGFTAIPGYDLMMKFKEHSLLQPEQNTDILVSSTKKNLQEKV